MRRLTTFMLGAVVLFGFGRALLADEPTANPFADAIEYAQDRTVKIYGAGVGRVAGYGTGMLVSEDGKILTIQGVYLSGQRIRVGLPDGTLHEAKVLRRSRELETALLQIEVKTPKYFELSDKPVGEVADLVVAVTNAFKVADGPEPLSVTSGIIAARTKVKGTRGGVDLAYNAEMTLIDTVTSNPGAGGGAVVTADGKVVGMVGKIMEEKNTGVRLNYAVPSDLLHTFLYRPGAAATVETVETPADLGLRVFTLGGKRGPAYIDRLTPSGPATEAGLRTDDLIVSINGQVVRTVADYERIAKKLRPGREVEVIVKRGANLVTARLDTN